MLKILTILLYFLFCCAFFLVMRFHLHMFQLNGYHRKEHDERMQKEAGKAVPLLACMILSVVCTAFPNIVTYLFLCASYIWVILLFNHYRVTRTKKKFVYTARMRRLIVCIVILFLIWIFIICMLFHAFHGVTVFAFASALFLLPVSITAADAIMSPIEKKVRNGFIDDAKRMLAEMPEMKIIGITGSYGKTSVKYYLSELLQVKYNVLITPESYNTPMGVVKTVRENLRPTHEFFLCEMGARHVGDIKELCDIVHPQYGMITSVGPQHLETFFNINNVVSTKFELADAVSPEGKVFLNFDNELIRRKAEEYSGIVSYSCDEAGDYRAENVSLMPSGTEFDVVAPNGDREHFSMQLIGKHNVENVVGAIACANFFGVELSAMKQAVKRLKPVKHRLELLNKGSYTVIDDAFNSNPAGSSAALDVLSLFEGTRILITPGMVELGSEEEKLNEEFGRHAASCCDYIVLIGSRRTEPILRGAISAGFSRDKIKTFEQFVDGYQYAASLGSEDRKYILLENDLPDNY